MIVGVGPTQTHTIAFGHALLSSCHTLYALAAPDWLRGLGRAGPGWGAEHVGLRMVGLTSQRRTCVRRSFDRYLALPTEQLTFTHQRSTVLSRLRRFVPVDLPAGAFIDFFVLRLHTCCMKFCVLHVKKLPKPPLTHLRLHEEFSGTHVCSAGIGRNIAIGLHLAATFLFHWRNVSGMCSHKFR